jgi:hypothetical protein
LKRKTEVLERHCEAEGRDPSTAEHLRAYIEAGFGGFTFSNQTLPTPGALGLAGELIKLLRWRRPARRLFLAH